LSCRSALPCRCTLALGSPSHIEGPLFVTGPICPVFGGTACDARENVVGLFCTSSASISVHKTSLLCPLVLPHPLWMPFWRGSVVLAFFVALLLLYIMASGSSGHQTTLNEIGISVSWRRSMRPLAGACASACAPQSTQFGLMCGASCASVMVTALTNMLREGQAEQRWPGFSGPVSI